MITTNEQFKITSFLKTIPEFKDIYNLQLMKKGMTNKSYTFISNNKKYILRTPGKGTDKLINRNQEGDVYDAIYNKNICDNIIYFNRNSGVKITEFIEDSRVCNVNNIQDLILCFDKLKEFHNMKLSVNHEFNIIEKTLFYESLLDGDASAYPNYCEVKNRILKLQEFINKQNKEYILTHMDAICDNFLITGSQIKLVDWEYAAMQDPHVDIAMFAIYSIFKKHQLDQIIDIYFENNCTDDTRLKIYSYVAMCGLLWSNWCEYKKKLGIDFGEYAKAQFHFADEYSSLVLNNL